MQLVLLVLSCFVGVALSQGSEEGRRCCIPQQFEGILHEAGGYYAKKYEKDGVFAKSIGVHYDGVHERVALGMIDSESHSRVKIIYDYAEGHVYLIRNGNCTHVPLHAHFKQPCIPAEATFRGAFHLGFGDNRLHLHGWSVPVHTREGDLFHVHFAMEPESCMPVTELAAGEVRGVDSVMVLSYSDLSAGIKDPSVFFPPAYCRQAEEMLEFDEMAIYGYMMSKHSKDFFDQD